MINKHLSCSEIQLSYSDRLANPQKM